MFHKLVILSFKIFTLNTELQNTKFDFIDLIRIKQALTMQKIF